LEIEDRPISNLQSLVLTSPDQGGRYRFSPEVPASAQQLFVAVRPAEGVVLREVTLFADGDPLATLTDPLYQARWQMAPGTHTFWAVGEDVWGSRVESDRVVIEVVE
jgi:hypothetical protein